MSRDEATLLDIAHAARLTLDFIAGMDKAAFFADAKTQSAVLHQLTVLGEAVKRLSRPFRDQHPILPWPPITGMRDHLIHGYDAVDLDEVWNTATSNVPDVLAKITPLLPQPTDKTP
jgi:uncharacterized protein with HEPN domain